MDARIIAVAPPEYVYRVARRDNDPFAPAPWEIANSDGTFGNRFDDPDAGRGVAPSQSFRMIYCASTAEGAIGETIARFRPSLSTLAGLRNIDVDAPIAAAGESRAVRPESARGIVPASWRLGRILAATALDPNLRFVDLAAPETQQALRQDLAADIVARGLGDLDLGVIAGPYRGLTQRIARHIYELHRGDSRSWFAGVRYPSRLNLRWECWAVFADRLVHTPQFSLSLSPDNPDLLSVCSLLDLDIELPDREDEMRPAGDR